MLVFCSAECGVLRFRFRLLTAGPVALDRATEEMEAENRRADYLYGTKNER